MIKAGFSTIPAICFWTWFQLTIKRIPARFMNSLAIPGCRLNLCSLKGKVRTFDFTSLNLHIASKIFTPLSNNVIIAKWEMKTAKWELITLITLQLMSWCTHVHVGNQLLLCTVHSLKMSSENSMKKKLEKTCCFIEVHEGFYLSMTIDNLIKCI